MAKIARGRIVVARARFCGLAGMDSKSADELNAWADRPQRASGNPDPADNPRRLRRRAKRLRCLLKERRSAPRRGPRRSASGNRAIARLGFAGSSPVSGVYNSRRVGRAGSSPSGRGFRWKTREVLAEWCGKGSERVSFSLMPMALESRSSLRRRP